MPIMQPNTIAYNSLLNTYVAIGNIDEACHLYQEMQANFDSGKNMDCRPDMHTYASVLNALQKSNRSEAAEAAEQIFSAIPSPDTVIYNTLINMYAQKGDFEKALNLLNQMQSDFASGKNKDCCPDMRLDFKHTSKVESIRCCRSRRANL
jgi:pentatricopeptide repeat protein